MRIFISISELLTFRCDYFSQVKFFPHPLFSAINLHSHFKIYFLIVEAIGIWIKWNRGEKIECFIKHNFFIGVSILHRISFIHLHCFLLAFSLLWTEAKDGNLQFEALLEANIDRNWLEHERDGSIYHFLRF